MRRLASAFVLLALAVGSAAGGEAGTPELRAIAEGYAKDGDMGRALAALKSTEPRALLAALRTVRHPSEAAVEGQREVDLEDGHETKTKLLIIAPSKEVIEKRGERGLGLVVLLHGLGGSNVHAIPMAKKIVQDHDVVCIAPSAKSVPASEMNVDDGIPELIKQGRHWWLYDSPRSFVLEGIKLAKSLYPIDPDRVAMGGMSMGGYGTWNIGLRRPDRFAGLSPLAGGVSRYGVETDSCKYTRALVENGRNLPVFAVHGDRDPIVPYKPDREAIDRLRQLGGKAEIRTLEGVDHGLAGVYRGNGDAGAEVVKFLGTQRRNPSPEAVHYVSVDARLDGAYWLRIAARAEKSKKPRLEGRIERDANRIVVSGSGVEKARVYIDDRLLDITKPITVVAGGVTRFSGKVQLDARAILESWRSREDEGLVYPAFVEVDPRTFQ